LGQTTGCLGNDIQNGSVVVVIIGNSTKDGHHFVCRCHGTLLLFTGLIIEYTNKSVSGILYTSDTQTHTYFATWMAKPTPLCASIIGIKFLTYHILPSPDRQTQSTPVHRFPFSCTPFTMVTMELYSFNHGYLGAVHGLPWSSTPVTVEVSSSTCAFVLSAGCHTDPVPPCMAVLQVSNCTCVNLGAIAQESTQHLLKFGILYCFFTSFMVVGS